VCFLAELMIFITLRIGKFFYSHPVIDLHGPWPERSSVRMRSATI
jgi:hypothetical protein